jgi:hypothetical protein
MAIKRAPTKADAPLDNEGTATTYFIGDGLPAVTGSPCGTGEAPALNPPSGASPYARIVGQKAALTLRLKKGRGPNAESTSGFQADLNPRQMVRIDAANNESLNLQCGDNAESLAIVDTRFIAAGAAN